MSRVGDLLALRKTVLALVHYAGKQWVRVHVVPPRKNARDKRYWVPRNVYFPQGCYKQPWEVIVRE